MTRKRHSAPTAALLCRSAARRSSATPALLARSRLAFGALCRFLGIALLAACAGPALPEPYVVRDLRVIALVVDPPEAAPGTTVRVTAWFYDPDGGGRPVVATLYRCAKGGSADCLISPDADNPTEILFSGTAQNVATDLHRFDVDIAIEADALSGVGFLEQIYGLQRTFVVRGDNGERTIDGLKRLVITPPFGPKNKNPAFTGFMIEQEGRDLGDDRAVTRLARNDPYVLRPLFDPATLQTYAVVDFNGELLTFVEEASFTWSCSPDCTIDQRTTFDQDIVTIRPPLLGAENDRFAIHVVMRDGRGGEAVLVRDFELGPETLNFTQ